MRALPLIVFFLFQFPLHAFGNTISFSIKPNEADGGTFFIPCAFTNYVSNCVLDTGSGSTSVNFNSSTKKFPVIGQAKFFGTTGISKECDRVNIDNLRLGQFQKQDVHAIRCTDSIPSNTIGMNVFRGHKLYFNFTSHKIETDFDIPFYLRTHELKIFPQVHLVVPIEIANHSYEALWDTGAQVTSVDESLVKEFPNHFKFVEDVSVFDSTEKLFKAKLYKMKSFKVGGILLPDSYVFAMNFKFKKMYFGPQMRLVLGINHIQKQNWYFDLQLRRWAIE